MMLKTTAGSTSPRYPWVLSYLGFVLLCSHATRAAVVKTVSGDVEGSTEDVGGVQVDAYLGVPFAKPPVGPLRFRAPEYVSAWTGVKDARTLPNSCMQYPDTSFGRFSGVEMWNPNTNLSEDCLYLNVWVPRTTGGEKLATIVWIYGGSFVYGSSTLDIYNGKMLAAKKSVIVASMNYRMGVHGFLYSETVDAPGNMGLLDQQMAMRWLHDNIESFGGDKARITLMGESAGSVSVNHHLLAPSSWPYFNNAIMLSSTSLANWAIDTRINLLHKFDSFAALMNCSSKSREKVVECLRAFDAETIEAKQWELDNGYIGTFSPVVDGKFLEAMPQDLLNSGKVKDADIILGSTKDEGEFFIVYFFQDVFKPENLWTPKPLTRAEYEDLVKRIGGFKDGLQLQSILYTYEESLMPSQRMSFRDTIDDILGDFLFKCPVHDYATQFSNLSPKKGRTYVYSFEYRHSANTWPAWMGVLHGYEIELALGMPFDSNLNYSAEDRTVSEYMMDYFTSFAKTGIPNYQSTVWPEFSEDREQHLVFTQDTKVVSKDDFRHKECSFWKDFFPEIRTESDALHSIRNRTIDTGTPANGNEIQSQETKTSGYKSVTNPVQVKDPPFGSDIVEDNTSQQDVPSSFETDRSDILLEYQIQYLKTQVEVQALEKELLEVKLRMLKRAEKQLVEIRAADLFRLLSEH